MKISAVVRDVYGNRHIYITDQKMNEAIGTLTGRKTLLRSDISALTKLGFIVDVFDPYQSMNQ